MRMIRHTPHQQFELASEGTHSAQLKKIKDLEPAVNSKEQETNRVRFVWEIKDEVNSSGAPLMVGSAYNLTLHPQSFLSKAIADITGHEPGREFDLDRLIGAEAELVVKHNQGADGRVFANVAAILRYRTVAEEAEAKPVATATQNVNAQPQADGMEITDADVPF